MRGRKVLTLMVVTVLLAAAVPATVKAIQSARPGDSRSERPATVAPARDSLGEDEPPFPFTGADPLLLGVPAAFLLAVGLSARALLPPDDPI